MLAFIAIFLQSPGPEHLLFQAEKAYAMLAVVLIIFIGIVLLLVRQERKLGKLERQMHDWQDTQNTPKP